MIKFPLQIGFGRAEVTPPIGTPLSGQLVSLAATGVESPLYATAMRIKSEAAEVIFVSCDVISVTNELADEISRLCGDATLILCATHTHSGPMLKDIFGYRSNSSAVSLLKQGILSAIRQAGDNLHPGTLKYASGKLPDLAFNRRFLMSDGRISTHPLTGDPHIVRPEGPDSDDLSVFCAENREGKVIGGMVVFGCHATVMERDNTLISSDFPGKTVKFLEEKFGGTFLFCQGACGNICQVNPRNPGRYEAGIAHAEYMGRTIAEKSGELLRSAKLLSGAIASAVVRLAIPRRQAAPELIGWAEKHRPLKATAPLLSNYGAERYGMLGGGMVSLDEMYGTPFWADFYAAEILTLRDAYREQPKLPFTVRLTVIGDAVTVALPCELFVEWQKKIMQLSPFPNTTVIELACGWNGYVPTAEAFEHNGGYETKEVTSTMLVPSAGEILCGAVINGLKQLDGELKNIVLHRRKT